MSINRSGAKITYEYASGERVCSEDDRAKARILDRLVEVLDMSDVTLLWRLVAAKREPAKALGPLHSLTSAIQPTQSGSPPEGQDPPVLNDEV